MSIQLVAWALEQRTGSVSRKAVLLALANCHNHHTGQCNPRLKRIAKETDLSVSTVQRAIDGLVAMGLVERIQRKRENGSLTSSEFRFPTSPYGQDDQTPQVTVTSLEPEVEPEVEPNLAPASRNGYKKIDRDRIWDTFTDIFGPVTTRQNETLRGRLVNELLGAGATPEEMVRRAKTWPQHFDSATLTAPALVKHWDTLGRKPLRRR